MPVKIGLAALCAHWFQEVGLQENGGWRRRCGGIMRVWWSAWQSSFRW